MSPARAKVSLFESKWIVQHIDDKHTCEPDSWKVIANCMKHRMKEEMRKNPSQPCGEAVKKLEFRLHLNMLMMKICTITLSLR